MFPHVSNHVPRTGCHVRRTCKKFRLHGGKKKPHKEKGLPRKKAAKKKVNGPPFRTETGKKQ